MKNFLAEMDRISYKKPRMFMNLMRITLLSVLLFTLAQRGSCSEPSGSELKWAWVQKIESYPAIDDKATALALVSDGVWVGGETLEKHFIQKFHPWGEAATERILFEGDGDSVNALAAGPDGTLYGAADFFTDLIKDQRPALFFQRDSGGAMKRLLLGTGTANSETGYGDAYGIDYHGGAVYLTGYVDPSLWPDPKKGYFQNKILDLSGVDIPDGDYAIFLSKITPGANPVVEWVKFAGDSIGETVKATPEAIYTGGSDGFVRAFDSAGNALWNTDLGFGINTVALASNGTLWVCCNGTPEIFRLRRSDGAVVDTKSLPGIRRVVAICPHPAGGLVFLGYGQWPGDAGREAGFRIFRLLEDGSAPWNKHISAGTRSRSDQSKIAVTSQGDIYVAMTVGASESEWLDSPVVFSQVSFEGHSKTFPINPNDGAAKGFLALLSANPPAAPVASGSGGSSVVNPDAQQAKKSKKKGGKSKSSSANKSGGAKKKSEAKKSGGKKKSDSKNSGGRRKKP
jgi:hypothetical protein